MYVCSVGVNSYAIKKFCNLNLCTTFLNVITRYTCNNTSRLVFIKTEKQKVNLLIFLVD